MALRARNPTDHSPTDLREFATIQPIKDEFNDFREGIPRERHLNSGTGFDGGQVRRKKEASVCGNPHESEWKIIDRVGKSSSVALWQAAGCPRCPPQLRKRDLVLVGGRGRTAARNVIQDLKSRLARHPDCTLEKCELSEVRKNPAEAMSPMP